MAGSAQEFEQMSRRRADGPQLQALPYSLALLSFSTFPYTVAGAHRASLLSVFTCSPSLSFYLLVHFFMSACCLLTRCLSPLLNPPLSPSVHQCFWVSLILSLLVSVSLFVCFYLSFYSSLWLFFLSLSPPSCVSVSVFL